MFSFDPSPLYIYIYVQKHRKSYNNPILPHTIQKHVFQKITDGVLKTIFLKEIQVVKTKGIMLESCFPIENKKINNKKSVTRRESTLNFIISDRSPMDQKTFIFYSFYLFISL